MRLIITFLMAWCLSWGAYAATAPDSKQITQELEQAKAEARAAGSRRGAPVCLKCA